MTCRVQDVRLSSKMRNWMNICVQTQERGQFSCGIITAITSLKKITFRKKYLNFPRKILKRFRYLMSHDLLILYCSLMFYCAERSKESVRDKKYTDRSKNRNFAVYETGQILLCFVRNFCRFL